MLESRLCYRNWIWKVEKSQLLSSKSLSKIAQALCRDIKITDVPLTCSPILAGKILSTSLSLFCSPVPSTFYYYLIPSTYVVEFSVRLEGLCKAVFSAHNKGKPNTYPPCRTITYFQLITQSDSNVVRNPCLKQCTVLIHL
jgi:hypothetical protein